MEQPAYTNRLAHETSPYLLQHAHNPVDWYPWGPEALQKAKAEDKPILLSIGYSSCHWCHVMAHESFEDAETARVMNELFINIKVDREERPDLDKIYQTSHQLLTQRGGGWPLTMFLTPEDQTPYFGGTYFPREERYGMPAFKELMRRVAGFYCSHHDEIAKQNQSLNHALQTLIPRIENPDLQLNASLLDMARHQLEKNFDPQYGGFGQAPKFPHPTNIERLLHHWAATATAENSKEDTQAREMARLTLHAMASGGIYDQLGGGFCRYSVDDRWMIPHFEKMLYDNGPLLALYSEAWQATGDTVFSRIAMETGQWVIREMQSPEGGFFSTLDADSEGVEGKFYAWNQEEVRQALGDEKQYELVAKYYGLDQPANFEGHWHLYVTKQPETVASELGLSEQEFFTQLQLVREKLFNVREHRVRPGRDEKILVSWNGLMIKGMARAGRLLQQDNFLASAERSLDFIRNHLWKEGRLLAVYKDGQAHIPAYLDDYVFLIDGILELLQARWRSDDLNFAIELMEVVLASFEDKDHGGFFFTAADHEHLILRPKPMADEALPSGNGIAAYVLVRLGHLLGEHRYLDAAERCIKAAWKEMSQMPYAYNALLLALENFLFPGQSIILRGANDQITEWKNRCEKYYTPRRITLAIPDDAQSLPGALAHYLSKKAVVAYVCSGFQCQAPIHQMNELEDLLSKAEVRTGTG